VLTAPRLGDVVKTRVDEIVDVDDAARWTRTLSGRQCHRLARAARRSTRAGATLEVVKVTPTDDDECRWRELSSVMAGRTPRNTWRWRRVIDATLQPVSQLGWPIDHLWSIDATVAFLTTTRLHLRGLSSTLMLWRNRNQREWRLGYQSINQSINQSLFYRTPINWPESWPTCRA